MRYKNYNKHMYIVYLLPHEYYVGQTNNSYNRIKKHQGNGKNTDEWYILKVCKNKQEARELEAVYHDKGYNGLSQNRSLTLEDVQNIRHLYNIKRYNQVELADIYNIDSSNVSRIIRKEWYKYI